MLKDLLFETLPKTTNDNNRTWASELLEDLILLGAVLGLAYLRGGGLGASGALGLPFKGR